MFICWKNRASMINISIILFLKKSKCLRYQISLYFQSLVGWFGEKSFLIPRQLGLLSLETQTTSDLSFLIFYSASGRGGLRVEEELFSKHKEFFAMRGHQRSFLLQSATSATQSSFYSYFTKVIKTIQHINRVLL